MAALKLITPATTYPVTLDEAKAHLNIDFDDDDALIEVYRKAATEDAENFTGRAFYDQTWDYYFDAFPSGNEIKIPRAPMIEVIGVFSRASGGDEVEMPEAGYQVDVASAPGRVVLASGGSWPSPTTNANAGRIRFRAGYVDQDVSPEAGLVPFAIKAAILLTIGTLYANRETVVIGQTATMMPWAAEQLLRSGDLCIRTALA